MKFASEPANEMLSDEQQAIFENKFCQKLQVHTALDESKKRQIKFLWDFFMH